VRQKNNSDCAALLGDDGRQGASVEDVARTAKDVHIDRVAGRRMRWREIRRTKLGVRGVREEGEQERQHGRNAMREHIPTPGQFGGNANMVVTIRVLTSGLV
jgi:hypothetical protein